MALACDLIVASEKATFGLPEVTLGLVAAAGGLFRLPRRVPYHLAMEIALTGGRPPAAPPPPAGPLHPPGTPGGGGPGGPGPPPPRGGPPPPPRGGGRQSN